MTPKLTTFNHSIFCGVLASPTSLPGFWIFMYRVSPFTYLVEGMLSTGVANQQITCADNEYLRFNAPVGSDCGTYMQPYLNTGYLASNTSTTCEYCTYSSTNVCRSPFLQIHRFRPLTVLFL